MEKDLNYWKKNAEEDYMKVPISVLCYITELEKVVLPQADVIKSVCDCTHTQACKICAESKDIDWSIIEQR